MHSMVEEHPTPTATLNLLDNAYRYWTGGGLPCTLIEPRSRAAWIHRESPYGLVFHNNDDDPLFIYGNERALSCFKYSREIFYGMPSRFSASAVDREARQALLKSVTTSGIAWGYNGYRVDRHGHPFMIYDGVVWEVLNDTGKRLGQAALFWLQPALDACTIKSDAQ